ncbi:alpha/beta fold hydrolase [Pseudoalteromonas sp. SR41-1]|uniref:alpha/beta fold hydrolase n=1 Tax=Pseudoalteromonas sp. SR41-1 TaxID=2760952 RepID=UPI001600FC43|nr:alpha/beta hydrolase [Pseudoalteromonas sp. SR41-1]MBB1280591.1 alpha/beta hydrolase [Pseudoalteromonas sp. SR41-1]
MTYKTTIQILFLLLLSNNALAKLTVVKVNGFDVEYELGGKGKHTILLETGGSAGLSDWDPIFESLTKHAKVIRYSRIGNGGSAQIKKNYSSEEYAAEAALLLKTLKIEEPVVYVAHSYGAYIARVFAATYPNQIKALMLIEPASEHDVDIMRAIDLPRAEKEIAAIKLDDIKNGMSNQYLDFWAKRPLPDYPQIADIPVTVIASVKKYKKPSVLFFTDKAREMWGDLHSKWANAFPQGEIVITNKSYHYPQNDEPEMVVAQVVKLLERTK